MSDGRQATCPANVWGAAGSEVREGKGSGNLRPTTTQAIRFVFQRNSTGPRALRQKRLIPFSHHFLEIGS
jgi:hypothetical protein